MKKILYTILALITIIQLSKADEITDDSLLTIGDTEAFNTYVNKLNSQLTEWYSANSSRFIARDLPDTNMIKDSVIYLPDSVYESRLKSLNSPIPMTYNSVVKRFIELYTVQRRNQLAHLLGRSAYYYPMFEEVLDRKGMPLELKHLATVESALNPNAVSRMGATGLWQFMYRTGLMYDLEVNSNVDLRRDPYLSTVAAADYLKHLHGIYDDWLLAIAAYNCGPGNVNRAIRRAGNKRAFWDVYPFLPRETRGYVPAFIAVNYAMSYHKEHFISAFPFDMPFTTDTIIVNQKIHLEKLSDNLDIDMELLRLLNPQFRRDIVPAAPDKIYVLSLPIEAALNFEVVKDSIYRQSDTHFEERLATNSNLNTTQTTTSSSPQNSAPPAGYTQLSYTVKSGDNLGFIAEWYGTTAQNIRNWNNIRGNTIRVGQKLNIYVPDSKTEHFKAVNDLTFAQKQARKNSPSVNQPSSNNLQKNIDGSNTYYTVRQGDSLWSIANQFPNVTVGELIRLNNIQNASRLMPGDKLIIEVSGK